MDRLLEDSEAELLVTPSWVRYEALQGYPSANPDIAMSAASLACVRYEVDEIGVPVGRMVSHVGVLEFSEELNESLLSVADGVDCFRGKAGDNAQIWRTTFWIMRASCCR